MRGHSTRAAPAPDASYDSLFIVRRLEGVLRGVTLSEVHLLAYLACLLSLYGRRPVSEWGYGFMHSQWGAPFSPDLARAADALVIGGRLTLEGDALRSTSAGRALGGALDGFGQHAPRRVFLDGACASVLALPAGVIRAGLSQEPSLRGAALHAAPRPLASEAVLDLLYAQFDALRRALGGTDAVGGRDLMGPAVVWLSYLAEVDAASRWGAPRLDPVTTELAGDPSSEQVPQRRLGRHGRPRAG